MMIIDKNDNDDSNNDDNAAAGGGGGGGGDGGGDGGGEGDGDGDGDDDDDDADEDDDDDGDDDATCTPVFHGISLVLRNCGLYGRAKKMVLCRGWRWKSTISLAAFIWCISWRHEQHKAWFIESQIRIENGGSYSI